jgi:hypothetical protein
VNHLNNMTAVVLIAIAVAVYFIPNWIASARKHPSANSIFVTNLLLGWTGLGWIAALIWSFTSFTQVAHAEVHASEPAVTDSKPCSYCAETIKKAAVVCRFCGRELKD